MWKPAIPFYSNLMLSSCDFNLESEVPDHPLGVSRWYPTESQAPSCGIVQLRIWTIKDRGLELVQIIGKSKDRISKKHVMWVGYSNNKPPIFGSLYQPFMVIRGMVYYCYTNIMNNAISLGSFHHNRRCAGKIWQMDVHPLQTCHRWWIIPIFFKHQTHLTFIRFHGDLCALHFELSELPNALVGTCYSDASAGVTWDSRVPVSFDTSLSLLAFFAAPAAAIVQWGLVDHNARIFPVQFLPCDNSYHVIKRRLFFRGGSWSIVQFPNLNLWLA